MRRGKILRSASGIDRRLGVVVDVRRSKNLVDDDAPCASSVFTEKGKLHANFHDPFFER